MVEKKVNYCQLLGLNPLKESTYTDEAIQKKIQAKKEKWTNDSRNKQNDPEQRFKSEKLVGMVDDIVRVMGDPMLRKREFLEGKTILKGKVQKLKSDCIVLSDGSYLVMPGITENYTKKLHWEGVTKADVVKLAEVKEGAPPKPVHDKAFNAFNSLRTVDTYTPIELLNTLIEHPNLEIALEPLSEGSSYSQIRNAFEMCDKRVNSVRPEILPEQDSYILALRSVKLVLADQDMEALLKYGRTYRSMVPVMETIEQEYNGQQLTRKYIDELVGVHISRDSDPVMAIAILQSFCYKRKIAANFSNTDSVMLRCPECGMMVQGGPNTVFCPCCGKNFKTVCPACNTAQQSNNTLCIKCGFNFKEGLNRAKGLELNFRMNMQKGMVSRAEKDLVQLKEVYSGYAGMAALEMQLSKAKSSISSLTKMIDESYSRKKYSHVRAVTEEMMKQYPEVLAENPTLKQKYDDAINHYNAAELYCQKAAVSDHRDQRMAMYVSAVEICPDHPVAMTKLREHPPSGPVDPAVRLINGSLAIRFEPPEDNTGLTYCIYRSRDSLPNVTEDTRPMVEIPTSTYMDKTMDPGVEYYYSIYSKRWGILSREGAHFGPVMTLAEVDKVGIEPIDGGLRITFNKPRGCSRVRLWRTEDSGGNGIGTEIALNGANIYDDIGLVGGKKYHYLFVAEYDGRNRVERSPGLVFSATPIEAPQPVRDMKIRWNKSDGSYTAKWGTEERVTLFMTPKKINISGTTVKMDDIHSWMTEIKPLQEYTDGVRFELPDGAVQYIYPIIVRGRFGIRGNETMVANLKPFRDVEKTISNKDCIITMSWPEEAIEAKLVVSNDEVRTLDDINAEILTVRREEYQEDKMIRIPMGRSEKMCINIFAVYKVGNETLPSRGIAIDLYSGESKKVRYTMKSERGNVRVDLTTDQSVRELPPMMAVQVARGIPLKRSDGEVIWRSDSNVPLTAGSGTVTFQAKVADMSNVRLFLVDEENYNLFRFVHPLYNRRT